MNTRLSNRSEFKKLFEEFYNPLCNFASQILQDNDLSEDIVQGVFVKIWEKREVLEINTSIKNYLFQSVKFNALDFIRRKKHESAYQKHALHQIDTAKVITDEPDKVMQKEQLMKAINDLPDRCQQIFKMSKLEGLTYKEISAYLKLSEKTVENQISRAFSILRGVLKDQIS